MIGVSTYTHLLQVDDDLWDVGLHGTMSYTHVITDRAITGLDDTAS
jgi:hypothetical protein